MACSALLLLLALFSFSAHSEEEESKGTTQWLSWPVTGYALSGPDLGILFPPAEHRFEAKAHKTVIIGLRADGTVVWKYVDTTTVVAEPSSEESVWDW